MREDGQLERGQLAQNQRGRDQEEGQRKERRNWRKGKGRSAGIGGRGKETRSRMGALEELLDKLVEEDCKNQQRLPPAGNIPPSDSLPSP